VGGHPGLVKERSRSVFAARETREL
jgi:hypothetical protein